MPRALPVRVSPLRLARRGERLAGALTVRDMPRLRAVVREPEGSVEVSLEFARDGEGSVIRGLLGTRLVLSCQRCLERLEWRMSVPVDTRVAGSEAEEADTGRECVLLDEDGEISVAAFVEDELLLALPEFPRHDEAECGVDMEQYQAPEDERHQNPFAALAGLKRADPS